MAALDEVTVAVGAFFARARAGVVSVDDFDVDGVAVEPAVDDVFDCVDAVRRAARRGLLVVVVDVFDFNGAVRRADRRGDFDDAVESAVDAFDSDDAVRRARLRLLLPLDVVDEFNDAVEPVLDGVGLAAAAGTFDCLGEPVALTLVLFGSLSSGKSITMLPS